MSERVKNDVFRTLIVKKRWLTYVNCVNNTFAKSASLVNLGFMFQKLTCKFCVLFFFSFFPRSNFNRLAVFCHVNRVVITDVQVAEIS